MNKIWNKKAVMGIFRVLHRVSVLYLVLPPRNGPLGWLQVQGYSMLSEAEMVLSASSYIMGH